MATPKIKNAAEIAQAQAKNVAATQAKAAAESRAAAALEKGRPILTQAISGTAKLTAALNAQIAAASNPGGVYDPVSGRVVKTSAQLKSEADTAKAAATGMNKYGGLTPEQIELSKVYGKERTDALAEAAGVVFVDVPGAIYEEEKQKSGNVAYDTISKILENYRITGLASVLESIRDEYPEASSEDILTLLQFDDRYNTKFNERFAANVDRLKAGKPVLSPADYLKLEQGYMKVFNAYNLPAFNTQFYYDTFIKGDLDIEEVTDRVQLGYDRVLNDQPVQTAFNQFFSALGFSDIVTGMLDTANQLPALERKVKAAEIGGAALRQGLVASELAATEAQANVGYTNVSRGTLGADVLGRQGLTKAQAEEGYKKIAQVLPTAEKLSSIYGGTEEQYGRLEAEQEQLQGLASAARKRQRLADIETAQFKKQSGLGKGALGSLTNI
jgi:hypothetical protein